MRLEVRDLEIAIHRRPIVRGVSLSVGDGEFVGMLGPNGCGKSTTLRAIYRLNHRYGGQILWDGRDAHEIPQREFAQHVAVVSQFNDIAFDFSVREVVMMGRSPHMGMLSRETSDDQQIVDEALSMVEMSGFAARSFASLSGGERQRVILARALAQKPQFLILDEPTNHLDIKHQLQTLAIARDLGVSCLAALHDLAMASHFVDRVYLMKEGRVVAGGEVDDVVTAERIRDVYGVDARVEPAASPEGEAAGGSAEPEGGPAAPRGLTITYAYPRRMAAREHDEGDGEGASTVERRG